MAKEVIAFELTKMLIEKGNYGGISRENESAEDFNAKYARSIAAMFNTFLDELKVDQ